MGWSIGYDSNWKRDIGYSVPAICDHPKCAKTIDRGLSYVCGTDPYGQPHGCGLYFCEKHRNYRCIKQGKEQVTVMLCERCNRRTPKEPFTPKLDTLEWIRHKLTDKSWVEWRKENKAEVKWLKQQLEARS